MIRLDVFRNSLLLWILALYWVLNYGFMLLRIPPGIPIGELVLVAAMLTINHRVVLPKFLKSSLLTPLLIWWGIGLMNVMAGIVEHGTWAIRDASHVIESVFLYVGFAYAGSDRAIEKLSKALPMFLLLVALYALTFPFREPLQALSPIIYNSQGIPSPFFFNYVNSALLLLIASGYSFNRYFANNRRRYLAMGIFSLTLALVLFPSRTLYIQTLVLSLYFIFYNRAQTKGRLKVLALMVGLPLVLMVLLVVSGLPINGRFGQGFSLAQYGQLFVEIFSGSDNQTTISSGTTTRWEWWMLIIEQWRQSLKNIFFGMGYGFPLVEFIAQGGTVVREPHNEVISILARGGVLSLMAFFCIQATLVYQAVVLGGFFREGSPYATVCIVFLLQVLLILSGMLGECPFAMSYVSIPYYFGAGVMCRLYRARRQLMESQLILTPADVYANGRDYAADENNWDGNGSDGIEAETAADS